MQYSFEDIARMLDHSLLNPAMTAGELEEGCRLALSYGVASVCIAPHYLKRCSALLAGGPVKAGTTVGFPHGGQTTATKLAETRQALAEGAEELDAVINIGRTRGGDWDYVHRELSELIGTIHAAGKKIKVIFENCYLDESQKVTLCEICGELKADWVKTSTGFGAGGATLEDLKLMRRHSPPGVQVKAAGGVRDLDSLLTVRAVGVTRVGATKTADILEECRRRLAAR